MKPRLFLAVLVLCSFLGTQIGAGIAFAQEQPPIPAEIKSIRVENIDGSDVTNGPLMAGATYTVSLEIEVGVDLGNNSLILATPMKKVEDVYWSLENEYPGIDTDLWQPGLAVIEFDVAKGMAEITLKGSVASDYTSEKLSNGDYLHFTKPISLVTLSLGPAGTTLDEWSVDVRDQAIVSYQQTLTEKRRLLQTTEADPKYEALAAELLTLAEALSSKGYVQNAIDLLNELPSSAAEFPVPVPEKSFLPYLAAIIVLALLLVGCIALYFKARGNSSFIREQIDEEAGKLDVLSIRMAKIDKQLGRDLDQVKEQLERISGR